MKLRVASACLAAFASIMPAFAQNAPSPGDPKIAAATEILRQTHAQDNASAMFDILVPPLVAQVKSHAPNLTDVQIKMISDMLLDEMKAALPDMTVANARIYAEHFTLDELEGIRNFYTTPLGQKLLAENPKIVKEAVPLGLAWGKRAATTALAHVIEKLRSQGVKL